MIIPNWLNPYLEKSEILRNLVQMLQNGKSDKDIAARFNIPDEVAVNARKKWRLYRENECPDCGNFPHDKVCDNPKCISNW